MAADAGVLLLKNATVTPTYNTTTAPAPYWPGGRGLFAVCSSGFNGATVTLQILGPDGVTWITAGSGTTFVGNNVGIFEAPPGPIQALISVATPSAGVYASAARIVS